jgi:RNA polymerase sigma-70 factor (ECF subfamily)
MRLTRKEEKELVLRAKQGDSEAMTVIYKEFEQEILRAAFGITKNPDDAQDIAAEAFMTFFQTIDRFNTDYPIRPWLHRIMHNQANSMFRKKNRMITGGDYFDNYASENSSQTDENLFDEEEISLLKKAMNMLSEDEKKMLSLFYMEDFTIADLAITFCIPEGTVKSRLFNSRKKLAKKVQSCKKGGHVA